jgi:competence protein ComFC
MIKLPGKWIFKPFLESIKVAQLSIFLCQCPLCGVDLVLEGEDMICRRCRDKIFMIDWGQPVCPVCSRPLGYEHERCGECLVHPPPFRKHISFGRYEEELRELILKYKYGGVEKLKHLLAGYYIEVYQRKIAISEPMGFDFIIPAPPDRGRKREFNPVLEVVKIFSKRLGIVLLTGRLVKVTKTLPQAGLTRSQRLHNLNGAFGLRGVSPSLKGKRILFVDDVYTTGTTIKKCTELLINEGADVVAMTLARSI